ncbi:MAG: methionine aminopeptidase [Phycisphaerales bacterium]|nr:MAG: methionine aminopeptidase [Phycisphaerales bacterium]
MPTVQDLPGPVLYDERDLAALARLAGDVRGVLDTLLRLAQGGAHTVQIQQACERLLARIGCRPLTASMRDARGRPFGLPCAISIDDVATHGRCSGELSAGQLVTIDVVASRGGYCADLADTVQVGGGRSAMLDALDAVWHAGLEAIQPGARWQAVALAMDRAARARGLQLAEGLAGHGIGLHSHELPVLPLRPGPAAEAVQLRPGLVLTLEPVLVAGQGALVESADGWSLRTADRRPAVGREAVVAVRADGAVVLGGPASLQQTPAGTCSS